MAAALRGNPAAAAASRGSIMGGGGGGCGCCCCCDLDQELMSSASRWLNCLICSGLTVAVGEGEATPAGPPGVGVAGGVAAVPLGGRVGDPARPLLPPSAGEEDVSIFKSFVECQLIFTDVSFYAFTMRCMICLFLCPRAFIFFIR